MSRVRGTACAVAVGLLFLAGCGSLDSVGLGFLGLQGANGDLVLAGSADAVGQSAQSALGRLGMLAVLSRQGEIVYVTTNTSNGARLTLVLEEEKDRDTPRTRIRVQWQNGKDDAVVAQLFGELTGQHAKRGQDP